MCVKNCETDYDIYYILHFKWKEFKTIIFSKPDIIENKWKGIDFPFISIVIFSHFNGFALSNRVVTFCFKITDCYDLVISLQIFVVDLVPNFDTFTDGCHAWTSAGEWPKIEFSFVHQCENIADLKKKCQFW